METARLTSTPSLRALAEEICRGRRLTLDQAMDLAENESIASLAALADFLRRHFHGDRADLCSIINAKAGKCPENCAFCAQSAHWPSAVAESYNCIDANVALAMAKRNEADGVTRFSLVTAGRELSDSQLTSCIDILRRLSQETRLSLCASMGILTPAKAARLYAAGARRYHCNLETSREFFPHICTSHRWEDKITTLTIARDAGLELCSGGIIGMGESRRDRLSLAISLREVGARSIPINILNPIAGTPLFKTPPLPHEEILLTFAMFRILVPEAVIRTAGGRSLLGKAQEDCFRAGANGAIVGNYLTTLGRDIESDLAMLARLGFSFPDCGLPNKEEETAAIPSILIAKAERQDIAAILALQKMAYQSEAALLNDHEIPPLKQKLEDVTEEFAHGLILKGLLDGEIIGSVRASSDAYTCFIGKLMVKPEHQEKGYGGQLLTEIEKIWPHRRYELFTSDKSAKNLKLYEKMGYKLFQERQVTPNLRFIFLEKIIDRTEEKPV